jgi:hypothetical protein
MEDNFPGLWKLWFKNQCVTDGHSPEGGFLMVGGRRKRARDWIVARNALKEMQNGDLIVVALPGCRIGRIGKVLDMRVEDKGWDHLIDGDPDDWKNGYMGRRIFVHWELENAPDSADLVVQLPEGVNMGRGTLARVHHHPVEWFREVIANPANWVGMVSDFPYERALSDYIAKYPGRLKAGLELYPNQKVREKVLRYGSRADVLLRDSDGKPVIVECKRESPGQEAVRQLRRYISRMKTKPGEQAGGILAHGGARTVDEKVWREGAGRPHVEFFHYKFDVDFSPSCHCS